MAWIGTENQQIAAAIRARRELSLRAGADDKEGARQARPPPGAMGEQNKGA